MEIDPRLIKLMQAIQDPNQRKIMAEQMSELMDAPELGELEQGAQGGQPQPLNIFEGLQ